MLGTPATPTASLHAFQHGWTVIAAVAFLAAIVGAAVLGTGRARPATTVVAAPAGAPVPGPVATRPVAPGAGVPLSSVNVAE